MDAEDVISFGFIALIVAGIGYIIYEAIGFYNQGGSPLQSLGSAVSTAVDAASAPVSTLVGGPSTADPGSSSNLFYQGIDNFFTTGSIYGNQGSN